mmetsp:Transcript_1072/g.1897  ORF Transcript_1072/g.1897 Transcript_1072/m.1897 type:complete len:211 (+) Transcript_1072:606-1238(+)
MTGHEMPVVSSAWWQASMFLMDLYEASASFWRICAMLLTSESRFCFLAMSSTIGCTFFSSRISILGISLIISSLLKTPVPLVSMRSTSLRYSRLRLSCDIRFSMSTSCATRFFTSSIVIVPRDTCACTLPMRRALETPLMITLAASSPRPSCFCRSFRYRLFSLVMAPSFSACCTLFWNAFSARPLCTSCTSTGVRPSTSPSCDRRRNSV